MKFIHNFFLDKGKKDRNKCKCIKTYLTDLEYESGEEIKVQPKQTILSKLYLFFLVQFEVVSHRR